MTTAEQQPLNSQHSVLTRRNFIGLIGLSGAGIIAKFAGDRYAPLSIKLAINDALFSPDQNTPNTIPIELNSDVDPLIKDEIDSYMSRLPKRLINTIGNDGYTVHVASTIQEVQAQYTGEKIVSGFTNAYTRQIVIYDPRDFPHEVAHAADFSYEYFSLSDEFLDASRTYFQHDLDIATKIDAYLQSSLSPTIDFDQVGFSESQARSNSIKKAFETISLSGHQRIDAIGNNSDLADTIRHLFVYSFMAYYFPELDVKEYKEQYPELLDVIQNFDNRVRNLR